MPVTKSAIKALRQTKRRTVVNAEIRAKMRTIIKSVKTGLGEKGLDEMYSTIDRAAKRGIIHPNKAARIKSRITKSVSGKDMSVASTPAKPSKTKKTTTKAKAPVKKAASKATVKKATAKASAKKTAKKSKPKTAKKTKKA